MMLDLEKFVFDKDMDPARISVLLAMSQNQDVERELVRQYRAMGARCAVTMLSGNDVAGRSKAIRSVIGLCLNEGLIEKKAQHIHPVAHATWEAAMGSRIMDANMGQNFCVKVAAVRCGCWFSLCFYGNLGMHELSAHRTVGLGVQVLGE